MRFVALMSLSILMACGGSTEPGKAGDPSILVSNHLSSSWVYITWKDGQGVAGRDSVAPQTLNQCVRFLAQPDSAYWEARVNDDPPGGGWAQQATPAWFNPADRPAWTLQAYPGGPVLLAADAATPC